ncbi:MAG: hypothetical protein K1566_03285 [Candidatus Thiodiazotropha sp. (ex. Lucinisca nassula)]|nr:hypothetical protein [Candidatus Thiodiazotropha sp. (ex. Lucinisca nassula)]MBW9268647.1 hypothetical protein [Candidatus Thiodiazotropha sp. (ex. Lucinisca nassula)]
MKLQPVIETPHPAAIWAETAPLDPLQVDCVTAVMLKILDNKCKMEPEQQMAITAIYTVVRQRQGALFEPTIHEKIDDALNADSAVSCQQIHELRLYAERVIPKPVMKHFKSYLRDSLYDLN